MVIIALIVMILATLANHLGLTEANSDIFRKIARCPKCCSFWATLFVLVLLECNLFIAIGLSILAAYLSYWVGLVFIIMQKLYNKVWERLR